MVRLVWWDTLLGPEETSVVAPVEGVAGVVASGVVVALHGRHTASCRAAFCLMVCLSCVVGRG